MRQLSSGMTYFYKYVFTTLWIGGFGLGTLVLLWNGDSIRMRSPDFPILMFPVVLVIGSVLLYLFCGRLKAVSLADQTLVISNFQKTINVPLRDVECVSGSLFMHPELVWITLKVTTEFGTNIQFMAPWRLIQGLTRPPIVAELNDLVERSKGLAPRA